jgi:hypothetical protein
MMTPREPRTRLSARTPLGDQPLERRKVADLMSAIIADSKWPIQVRFLG